MNDSDVMQPNTQFTQVRECPSCNTYYRHSGRRAVGRVEYEESHTCPNCHAS
ncbi:MAG: hypothetical protein ABEJ60_06755 [Halodesulfurarchaeum sp.]